GVRWAGRPRAGGPRGRRPRAVRRAPLVAGGHGLGPARAGPRGRAGGTTPRRGGDGRPRAGGGGGRVAAGTTARRGVRGRRRPGGGSAGSAVALMLLDEVARTSADLAATSKRLAK